MYSKPTIIAIGAVALILGIASTTTDVATTAVTLSHDTEEGNTLAELFVPETTLASATMDTVDNTAANSSNPSAPTGEADSATANSNSQNALLADEPASISNLSGTTKSTINVTVNDEPMAPSDTPDAKLTVTTGNTGTLDGDTHKNDIKIEREIEIDVENDNEIDTDIDREFNVGGDRIKGEKQDVGDIRPGTVTINLGGLED